MSEVIEYISPKLLKPDPHQPRKDFDEEFIKNLANTYSEQGIIEPIEVDEDNLIIRGEQRWRGAILKKLPEVRVLRKSGLTRKARLERQLIEDANRKELNVMERAWAYGTAIVNINTGENYTIEDVKEMKRELLQKLVATRTVWNNGDRQDGGASELSRIIGVLQQTIGTYVQCLYLEPETQKLIGAEKGKIPHTYARVVTRLYPDHKEKQKEIEQLLRETTIDKEGKTVRKHFKTRQELEQTVNNYFKILEQETEKKVEELEQTETTQTENPSQPPTITPTQNAINKAATKQKKKQKSVLDQAQKSINDVEKKIAKATKKGIDVSEFEARLEEIRTTILTDPKLAHKNAKPLKKDLDEANKSEEKRIEEEKQKKHDEEIRRQAEEEARLKLLQNKEFLQQASTLAAQTLNEEQSEEDTSPNDESTTSELSDKEDEFSPDFKGPYTNIDAWLNNYSKTLKNIDPKHFKSNGILQKSAQYAIIKTILKENKFSCPICGNTKIVRECGHDI